MPEPHTTIMMKHNPGFLSAEELIASFIARQAEFEVLLEIVRNNSRESNQHALVIGRRGMGKTTLVHRLALALEQDRELATRWYPLIFGEEAYGVGSAGELWLEALHQLATKTGEARWRNIHAELRREPEERLRELALARLLDFAEERGVRLLVVVENLQDILGVQMSKDSGWTLRHTLLNEPRIMLLATATNRFDDIDTPKAATYGMFRVIQLQALEREECRVLWQRLTGEYLEDQRIRPIEIFTGGNPRLLTILAGFAKGRALREFMSDLLGLIDDHSDYFKSNLEALSLEERRAFIALCELWEPSPARAVAEVARFDVNKASMLLGRLVNRGAVEVVRARGRTQYYQVCERLYNLFHRLRRSSTRDNRAASVVEFMTRFYGGDEVSALATRIVRETCEADSETREDHLLVLHHLLERAPDIRSSVIRALPKEFWGMPEVRRPDLHWSEAWKSQHFRKLAVALTSAWPGPVEDVEEMDRPVIRLWEQVIAEAITPQECIGRAVQYRGTASEAALSFCMVAAFVRGNEPLAQEMLDRGPSVRLAFGVCASVGWSDPQFRAFTESHLRAAIAADETLRDVEGLLIECYERSGDIESIVAIHEQSIARNPTAEAYRAIGDLLVSRDLERAESAYRSALALAPHNRQVMFCHTRALLVLERLDEAEQSAGEWLATRPDDHAMASLRMSALVQLENPDAALRLLHEHFSTPLEIDFSSAPPGDWVFALWLASVHFNPAKFREFTQALVQHVSKLDEPEARPWFGLGAVLSHSSDPVILELAAEWLSKIPGFVHAALVKFALHAEGSERAFEVLERVARDNPDALGDLLGLHRDTLMQLALADPERLHAFASTIPLFEALAVALAGELGHDVLAPYEVSEIAKDIRAELARLRGPSANTRYQVEVPIFAAAEDAPRRAAKKPTTRKPATKTSATKKPATKTSATKKPAAKPRKR